MNEIISICILAYNHEQFIEKVLDGIFMQELSYSFKVFINDDCSTDQTVQIIEKYQAIYPNKITLFKNDQNRGQLHALENFIPNLTGRYVTISDGDDYWIEKSKLQKQIDFLESHPDYIACCHDALIESFDIDGENAIAKLQSKSNFKYISQFTKYSSNEIQPYELLIGQTYIQNCTLVWRNFELSTEIKNIKNINFNLDWYFNVILASKGKIYFQNVAWSVYSDHPNSETKNTLFHSYLSDKIKLLKHLFKNEFYNKPYYRYMLYELISKEYYGLILLKSQKKKSTKFILKCALNYSRYSFFKTTSFLWYVWKYRKQFD